LKEIVCDDYHLFSSNVKDYCCGSRWYFNVNMGLKHHVTAMYCYTATNPCIDQWRNWYLFYCLIINWLIIWCERRLVQNTWMSFSSLCIFRVPIMRLHTFNIGL